MEKHTKLSSIDVLRRYQTWEAKALNCDTPCLFDDMEDELYNDWMEIQKLREEVLLREAQGEQFD